YRVETVQLGKDAADQVIRREAAVSTHYIGEPAAAELRTRRTHVVGDAIGVQHDDVARLRLERKFLIAGGFQKPDGDAFDLYFDDFGPAANHGRYRTGVGDDNLARRRVPQQHAQSHITRLHLTFHEYIIQGAQQFRGTPTAWGQRTQQAGS